MPSTQIHSRQCTSMSWTSKYTTPTMQATQWPNPPSEKTFLALTWLRCLSCLKLSLSCLKYHFRQLSQLSQVKARSVFPDALCTQLQPVHSTMHQCHIKQAPTILQFPIHYIPLHYSVEVSPPSQLTTTTTTVMMQIPIILLVIRTSFWHSKTLT